MKNLKSAKGFIYACIAAISYGVNPLFALPMYAEGISADWVLFYRYVGAILLLTFWMLHKPRLFRIERKHVLPLLVMGVLFSFSSLFLFLSYQYMDAGIASTLLFIYPVLVALIMAIFYGERINFVTQIAIGLAFCGVLLLCHTSGGGFVSPVGILYVAISSLAYAIYMVGVNKTSLHTLHPITLNYYALCFGSLVYVVRLHFLIDFVPLPTPKLWLCAAGLALFPTIVSLTTLTKAIQLIGSTPTAIIGALEPLTALFFGVTVFHEAFTLRIACGVLLILFAVSMLMMSDRIGRRLRRTRVARPRS